MRSIFDTTELPLFGSHTTITTAGSGRRQEGGRLLLDPAKREHSGFGRQFGLFLRRSLAQQYRPFSTVLVDYALIFLAGGMFGMAQKNIQLLQLPLSGALIGLGIGLTTITSSTRLFGRERVPSSGE